MSMVALTLGHAAFIFKISKILDMLLKIRRQQLTDGMVFGKQLTYTFYRCTNERTSKY